MKNKTIVRIFISALILLILSSMVSTVFGKGLDPSIYTDPSAYGGLNSTAGDSVQSISGKIVNVIQIVAMSVAVIMLIYMGIKYVTASPSEKADVKKGMMIYVVGAVLLFSTAGILQIIRSFGKQALGEAGSTQP